MKVDAGLRTLAISLIIACLAPASAVAKRGYFTTDASSSVQAQHRGSNGYAISLSGGGFGFVTLTAKGHHATIQYFTKGVAGKGKIKARFGSLGRVALRFHPRGKARLRKDPERSCSGGDTRVQPGVFMGKLDFEGEQDYTAIHATRIEGTVTHTEREVCKKSGSEEGGEEGFPSSLRLTFLSATDDEGESSFSAFKFESKAKPSLSAASFNATLLEEFPQSGLSVFRSIEATTKDSDAFSVVTSNGRVDEAMVTPPAPFAGSATYRRAVAKKSETWAGSLTGEFPGLGTVSLAGPEFCAEAVLLKGCNGPVAGLAGLFG
ncbi:MAG TPA: hypothetical protein VJQ84_10960 [Solirubrobacterales bacterium]|nr:hypothetical protein [Solirubrobacterales bacterium]